MTDREMRVAVLGHGNVGAPFVALVASRAAAVAERTGLRPVVTRVLVRNLTKHSDAGLAAGVLTRDGESIVTDPEVDLVVETMGGIEPARGLLLAALAAGKPVITANKELLANHGAELARAADEVGVDLLFEAAVAAGIPILRPLRESLAGEDIRRVMGILNGTTNFILTRMTEQGSGYAEALAEAQSLGYAEPDPTADVEGHDAAAKAAIVATLAFGAHVVHGDVDSEGISSITAQDITSAARLHHVIKLLAVCERVDGDDGFEVAVRVHPAMVPLAHPLAGVRDSFNAVFIEGAAAGQLMFLGRGAGGDPTASALLGDLVDAAGNLAKGTHATLVASGRARIRAVDEQRSPFYISLDADDRPGVLRAIAEVFERHDVSIRSLEQEGIGDEARIVFITHTAREADIAATLADLRHLDPVHTVGSVLRVVAET